MIKGIDHVGDVRLKLNVEKKLTILDHIGKIYLAITDGITPLKKQEKKIIGTQTKAIITFFTYIRNSIRVGIV